MGRLRRLHKGRSSPLHEVEETIAALHEELEFTLNFAHAMVVDENYHSAAGAIDEQRRSLAKASLKMEQALRKPEVERAKVRARVALAGVAATLALASGAFAAFGPPGRAPARETQMQAIEQASAALTKAAEITDPAQLQAIVVSAQQTILEAAQLAPTDPAFTQTLLDSVEKLQTVIRANPNLPAPVRERAQEVAAEVTETLEQVAEVPVTPEEVPEDEAPSEAPSETPSV